MQPSTRRRIKRLVAHAITTIVVAFLVFAAADFAGPGWYQELLSWLQPTPRVAAASHAARPLPLGPPVSVTPIKPEGNDSSVSPTPLPLILVRTERGRNSREGFAQIGVRALSPQTYMAGALLANGARLAEIYDHYVVLERDGRSARLYLHGEGQPEIRAARGLLSVGAAPEPVTSAPDSHEALTDYLRPNPSFLNDELRGYTLHPGRKASAFSRLGLQTGDLLTHIGGMAISNTPDSLRALHKLLEGEVLMVEIERQGVPQTLSLDGAILRREALTDRESAPSPQPTSVGQMPAPELTSVALRSLLTQGNKQ